MRKSEIIDLFAAKLLNFVRNPFCIEKVLNSFPGVATRKPHQAYLCERLGISHQTYVEWLRLMFILLMQTGPDRPNLFEGMIKVLFEARDTQAAAFVWAYDQEHCLLSDRSFCPPIPDGPHMAMSFNLCSTAFVDYIFADAATLVQSRASPAFVEGALAAWRQRPQATVNVTMTRNNREMLARYIGGWSSSDETSSRRRPVCLSNGWPILPPMKSTSPVQARQAGDAPYPRRRDARLAPRAP